MQHIVAVSATDDQDRPGVMIYRRDGLKVTSQSLSFRPWFVSELKHGKNRVRELSGGNPLKYLHSFGDWRACEESMRFHHPTRRLSWGFGEQQYLALNPEDYLFQGMQFGDLVRMQIDLETTGLDPESDRILMIAWKVCGQAQDEGVILRDSEIEMLADLHGLIHKYDPDTIEGHNLYQFDLPFLLKRAEKEGLSLWWGRNGNPVFQEDRERRFRIGSTDRPVRVSHCFGRHLVDSYLVAARYDANTGGKFESFGLKYLAEVMGVQEEDRVILDRSVLGETFIRDPELVERYALQDVRETASIVELMVQPEFYLTTLLPDTFQNVLLSGGGMKINQILCSEYVRKRCSLPARPKERPEFEGGHVELRQSGLFHNVAKADVASLYPSIMLMLPVKPPADHLGVFQQTLESLTKKRLEIKAQARDAEGAERQRLTGIEKAYKIIINSYYGYLGCGLNFSDYDQAARVTETGREIVLAMERQLAEVHCGIIEVDTDGVYFTVPDGIEPEWIPSILQMPAGINVEVEDVYPRMLSLKAKNYVLEKRNGSLEFHGVSLRSRATEPFGKRFLDQAVRALMDDDHEEVVVIYEDILMGLMLKTLPREDYGRPTRVTQKVLTSPLKRRVKEAMELMEQELSEGDSFLVYQRSDGTLAPLDQWDNDVDLVYYWTRLYKYAERLAPLLQPHGIEFQKPGKRIFKKLMEGMT